ncbi:MAG: DUF3422 family protein [Pseudomonadota bacterium]
MAQISLLADRRPTYLVDTPCLTRQYTFRPDWDADPVTANGQLPPARPFWRRRNGKTDASRRKVRLATIFDHLNGYLDGLTNGEAGTRFGDPLSDRKPANATAVYDRYRSIFVSVVRFGVPIEIIIDIHTEYISVNLRAYPAVGQSEKSYGERLVKTLTALSCDDHERLEWTHNDIANQAFMDMIYDGFWSDHLAGTEDPRVFLDSLGLDHPYQTVAIFKGMVLRRADNEDQFADHCEQLLVDLEPETTIDRPVVVEQYLTPPPNKDISAGVPGNHRLTDPNFVALQRMLNRHPGFFTRILGFRRARLRSDDYQGGNAILCGFLDGLAIFGSSFGHEQETDGTVAESNYFMLYDGPSRNQLARLIRRIHFCGDNRLFALIDYRLVREAADRLRAILRRLEDLNSRRETSAEQVKHLTIQVEQETRKVRGGLRYRISRTAYYWSTLQDRITNLRTRRIVGWQTYDEFVARIFGPQVDSYMRLRDELRRIEDNIVEADQLITAKSNHGLQILLVPFVFFSYFEMLGYMDDNGFWAWVDAAARQYVPGVAGFEVPIWLRVLVPIAALFSLYLLGYAALSQVKSHLKRPR